MDNGITKLLSAVVITKNEEKNIVSCIRSLQPVADEIVVVDSFSTDRTAELCREMGVRFIQKEWMGYASTKNWANEQASNDHILSLDADEELSAELQQSISAVKASDGTFLYSFSRLTNYCGHWIRHGGWFPDVKVRLFDRRYSRWEGQYVHETLMTDGNPEPGLLDGLCRHYSFHSIEQHVEQVNKYSTLAAQEKFHQGKRAGMGKLIFSPLFSFIKMYFFQGGIMDGRYGFVIAVISAYARFLRYAKLMRMGDKG